MRVTLELDKNQLKQAILESLKSNKMAEGLSIEQIRLFHIEDGVQKELTNLKIVIGD